MTTTRGGGEIGLRSCAEATVIEDLLEVITPVSGLVKRNLDLIRQLGATATSELEAVEKEEAKVEKDVVEELDKRAAAAKPAKKLEEVISDKKDFEERAEKRRRCDGLLKEPIAPSSFLGSLFKVLFVADDVLELLRGLRGRRALVELLDDVLLDLGLLLLNSFQLRRRRRAELSY